MPENEKNGQKTGTGALRYRSKDAKPAPAVGSCPIRDDFLVSYIWGPKKKEGKVVDKSHFRSRHYRMGYGLSYKEYLHATQLDRFQLVFVYFLNFQYAAIAPIVIVPSSMHLRICCCLFSRLTHWEYGISPLKDTIV